ncbi:hypothetical protein PENSPDRAFT_606968 [Peniophora sp. CONT]|nr:hypothetical protein PENSPDRAFT_606968 [Peniophora sp. CONT]
MSSELLDNSTMGDSDVSQVQRLAESRTTGSDVLDAHAKPWLDLVKERLASVGITNCSGLGIQDDVVRDFIEGEVQGALLAISSLRYRQNMLPPINKLPPELLSRIFYELSLNEITNRYYLLTSWVAVTYVCRTWRSTALDSAFLWTDIPLILGPLWSQAFALRSKAAPLSITVVPVGGYAPTASEISKPSWQYDLVKEHFSRLATAYISGYSNVQTFRDLLELSTPRQLRSLSLVNSHSGFYETPSLKLISLRDASQLQNIYMDRVSLAWDTLPWGGLRSVEIIEPPSGSPVSDFPSLIASLKSTTVLESLKLGLKSCKFDVKTIDTKSTAVQLPHICAFSLTGYAADCRALLGAVEIPAIATLSIDMLEDTRGVAELSILSDLLRAHSGFATSEPVVRIQSLSLEVDPSNGKVQLRAWRSCEENFESDLIRPSHAFVNITLRSKAALWSNLSNMPRDVNLASLRRLHVDFSLVIADNAPWKKAIWHKLFASAKKVQVLDFTGRCAYQLLKALSIPLTTPATASPVADASSTAAADGVSAGTQKRAKPPRSAMMFPPLQRVLLTGCACDTTDDHNLNKTLVTPIKRRMLSAPFKTLSISECTIEEDTVRELEKIKALKVDWDGVTGNTEDEDEDEECDFCDGEGCEECMDDYYEDDFY